MKAIIEREATFKNNSDKEVTRTEQTILIRRLQGQNKSSSALAHDTQ